jgi:hypothetical protein
VSRRLTQEQFVEKANSVHGDRYTYLEQYVCTDRYLCINCPVHGIFKQTPHNHINGVGCPHCANDARAIKYRKGIDLFIIQANIIHNNKYKYSGNYINTHTLIEIECPIHGLFLQAPVHHLHGHGCAKCNLGYNVSKLETQWLDSLNILEEYRQLAFKIGNKKNKTDAFNKDTHTVYEFYGDFWHGNPNKYNKNDINILNKKTFGELYKATITREELIKSAGYKIISIWESDWIKAKNE